jgi:hypothetical protein
VYCQLMSSSAAMYKSVNHSLLGARILCCSDVITRFSPREQLSRGCTQTSDEGSRLWLHRPSVEERGSCEVADSADHRSKPTTIRPICCFSRRFQPEAGGGMTVEGRHEARECSRGYGGRVSAATDRYSTSIHRAVGKVRLLRPQISPDDPTQGAEPLGRPRRA